MPTDKLGVNTTNDLWAIALLMLMTLVLYGCGGAMTPRPQQEERATISEYKGWTIAVTPARIDTNQWRARVRVWPPEVRPALHPSIHLSVSETGVDREGAMQAGIAAGRRYIDASQPVHEQR